MPVVTRGQKSAEVEAATILLSLRSSRVQQSRRHNSQPSSGDSGSNRGSRPVRDAARTARTLIRLSVEALNQEE